MEAASKPRFLSIKQFAQLCRSTARTIRFYSINGLIRPIKIDRSSNYRYYEPTQARRYFQIKLLQNFHLSLQSIKSALRSTNKEKFLQTQLDILKGELEERQKEYQFLTNIRQFLFAGSIKSLLKSDSIGPYVLLCRMEESGSFDQINSYIENLQTNATEVGLKHTGQAMVFYHDPSPFKPTYCRIETNIILKGKVNTKINLPPGCYFKSYSKTYTKAFDYHGPFEYIPLIYQKLQEPKYGLGQLDLADLGWDLYFKGPWNTSSDYDYQTKICFPANTNLK